MLKPEFISGKSGNIPRYTKYLEAWIILFSCEASTVVMASSKLDFALVTWLRHGLNLFLYLLHEWVIIYSMQNSMMLSLLLRFYIFRVNRVYPNLRVPEPAGSGFLGLFSGNNSHYPNFWKPELPYPNFAGYPNAQG